MPSRRDRMHFSLFSKTNNQHLFLNKSPSPAFFFNSLNRRSKPRSMAFWGALVRINEPVNVVIDGGPYRRLRITQAVLGQSVAACMRSSSSLYCSVGENPPVCVCSLGLPGIEMFPLDIQFAAPDCPVFSVLGDRDVHISGYYFDDYPPSYGVMQQIAAPNAEKVGTGRARLAVEFPDGDPQIGGPRAPVQQVPTFVQEAASTQTWELSCGKDFGLKRVDKSVTEAGQFKNHVDDSCSPSVAEDSLQLSVNIGDPHQSLVSFEAPHEMGEKPESLPFVDAPEESASHDLADHHESLVDENRSPSISECLGIVIQAPPRQSMNVRASGQRQPIFSYDWKEMQNLLTYICYGLLTKFPYMMNWTNIATSLRRMEIQESLQVRYPMIGCVKHGVNLGRNVEKIISYELGQPSNITEENESIRLTDKNDLLGELGQHVELVQENGISSIDECMASIATEKSLISGDGQNEPEGRPTRKSRMREVESTESDESLNNNLTGNNERLVDKQNIKPKWKKQTSKGLSACKGSINVVQLESVHPMKANDGDSSQFVNKGRLKPKKKKRRTDSSSMSVGLTRIRIEASEPNQQSDGVEQRKGVDCSKGEILLKKNKAAKWILKCRGANENLLPLPGGWGSTMADQDLFSSMSQDVDKDSRHSIIDEQDKEKQSLVQDEHLEACDADYVGEIKTRLQKKKKRTEQVIVPALDDKQGHRSLVQDQELEACVDAGEIKTRKQKKKRTEQAPVVDNRQGSKSVELVGTKVASGSVGNIIVCALLAEHPKFKRRIVKEEAPELPCPTVRPYEVGDSGEIKKKKKKTEKVEGLASDEGLRCFPVERARRQLFCAQDENDNNQKIHSALCADGHLKSKHDLVGLEETLEIPSHMYDSGDVKKKKGKKKH